LSSKQKSDHCPGFFPFLYVYVCEYFRSSSIFFSGNMRGIVSSIVCMHLATFRDGSSCSDVVRGTADRGSRVGLRYLDNFHWLMLLIVYGQVDVAMRRRATRRQGATMGAAQVVPHPSPSSPYFVRGLGNGRLRPCDGGRSERRAQLDHFVLAEVSPGPARAAAQAPQCMQ